MRAAGAQRGGLKVRKREEKKNGLGHCIGPWFRPTNGGENGPSWAGIGPRLKEMGLRGAMGGMGSDYLQFDLIFLSLLDHSS